MIHLTYPGSCFIEIPPAIRTQLCKWAETDDQKHSLSGEPWHMAQGWNSSGRGRWFGFISFVLAHFRPFPLCLPSCPSLSSSYSPHCFLGQSFHTWGWEYNVHAFFIITCCYIFKTIWRKNTKKQSQSVMKFSDIFDANTWTFAINLDTLWNRRFQYSGLLTHRPGFGYDEWVRQRHLPHDASY